MSCVVRVELSNRRSQPSSPDRGPMLGRGAARHRFAFAVLFMAACCGAAPRAMAAEVDLADDFLTGLVEREYFDYARHYLDALGEKPSLPDEMKESLLWRRALVDIAAAKAASVPAKRLELLDQALKFLDAFVAASPNHPEAANANSERAEILLNQGRAQILAAKSPANASTKAELMRQARELLEKASETFSAAKEQQTKLLKEYPVNIDVGREPKKAAARDRTEQNKIAAALGAGHAKLETARTYETREPEYKLLLTEAADIYEAVHNEYRTAAVGLYARLYQGKCLEEQGDVKRALGLFQELLNHSQRDAEVDRVKDIALQYRFSCLNSDQEKSHQKVIDEGEEWLKSNAGELRTTTGLGIRWEVARAYELQSESKDVLKSEGEKLLRQALNHARQLAKFTGEFRDVSLTMTRRLETKLGGKEKLPDKFDLAFNLAKQSLGQVKELRETIDAMRRDKRAAADIKAVEQDLQTNLNDAMRLLQHSVALASKGDDASAVAQARYLLGYVYYLNKQIYEAAVLCGYAARTAPIVEDDDTPQDAAFLALHCYVQAYNDNPAPDEEKQADMRLVVRASTVITDRWPESERSNEARQLLGRLYSRMKRPAEAAQWFGKVPEADPKYAESQLNAGQAYWTAYLGAASLPAERRPAVDQLAAWKASSRQHLQTGIAKIVSGLPKQGVSPPELIAAKMSLAQILISEGSEAEAASTLANDPHSVVAAVAVPDEAKRPAKGVQSRNFAQESYKLLLRAYIGVGRLDEARATMKTLEKIVGASGGSDVTDLYIGLGRLLREELKRFDQTGETERYQNLMTSFETFLGDMLERKEGQTFGSLSWIGETYFALGESMHDNPGKSADFYEKAVNAFDEILKIAGNKSDFVPTEQIPNVKTRMVRGHRLRKNFDEAESLAKEVLALRPNDWRLQQEATQIFHDRGGSGLDVEAASLQKAIKGDPDSRIWGWGELASQLQRRLQTEQRSEWNEAFLDARYNLAVCRQRLAGSLPNAAKRSSEYEKAARGLVATLAVTKPVSDAQRTRYNELYRSIRQDAGQPVEDMPALEDFGPATTEPAEPKPTAAAQPAEPEVVTPKSIDLTTWIGVGVLLVGGVGGVACMLMSGGKSKRLTGTQQDDLKPALNFAMAAPVGPPVSKTDDISGFDPFASMPAPKPKASAAAPTRPAARTASSPGVDVAPSAAAPSPKPAARPAAPSATPGSAPAPRPAAPRPTGETPAAAAAPRPRPPAAASGPGAPAPTRPAAPRPAAPPGTPAAGSPQPVPKPRPPGAAPPGSAPQRPKPPPPPAT